MTLHFDRESQRADRIARRERRLLYVGGVRAMVALGAFVAAIAYVIGSDNPSGAAHTTRGLIAAAASAAPFWLVALWGAAWREPKLAPYTFMALQGDQEQTVVRECEDDHVAIQLALTGLGGEGSSITVGRGPPDRALTLGLWTVVDGYADWNPTQPEWSLHQAPSRRRMP